MQHEYADVRVSLNTEPDVDPGEFWSRKMSTVDLRDASGLYNGFFTASDRYAMTSLALDVNSPSCSIIPQRKCSFHSVPVDSRRRSFSSTLLSSTADPFHIIFDLIWIIAYLSLVASTSRSISQMFYLILSISTAPSCESASSHLCPPPTP